MPPTRWPAPRPACLVLLVVLFAAGQAAGADAPNPVNKLVGDMERDVKALQAARDRLLPQARAKDAAGKSAWVVQFRLPGVLSIPVRHLSFQKGDLDVVLRRNGDAWLPGAATNTGGRQVPHLVDASALAWDGDARKGSLKGRLRIELNYRVDGNYSSQRKLEVLFALEAAVEAGQMTGTFATGGVPPVPQTPRMVLAHDDGNALYVDAGLIPPRKGALSGAVTEAALPLAAPPEPKEDIAAGYEAWTYARAKWLEATACLLYRQIHACGLTLEHGLPLGHAWALTPAYAPARPALEGHGPAHAAPKDPKKGDPKKPDPKKPDPKKPPPPPKIPQPLEGLGNDEAPGSSADRDAAAKARLERLAVAIQPLQSYAGRLRAVAEGYRPGAPGAEPVVGSSACGDPAFGPWFGEELLPREGAQPNCLPADAGRAGAQEWRLVGGWRFAPPLPLVLRDAYLPALPEALPDPAAAQAHSLSIIEDPTPDPEALKGCLGLGHTHLPAGPLDAKGHAQASPVGSTYACAEVSSPAAAEPWAGLILNGRGALWVNERLVWRAPPFCHPDSEEENYLFNLPLAPGANRLLLRVDTYTADPYFSLRLCTRGAPRPAPEAQRREAELASACRALTQPATQTRGFRNDGSGHFANCAPPLAFDLERKFNVLWVKPLSFCHAMPVIVGDKLFTSVEPDTLICLNKNDGTVLWERDCDITELKGGELLQESKAAREASRKAAQELAALGARKDDQEKALTDKGLTAEQAKAKLKELSDRHNAPTAVLHKAGVLGPAWKTWTGHTIATPVTDGKLLWVKYNTGVLACFDLDGNRKWMVEHHGTTGTNSHVPSLLLVNGKVIVMAPDGQFGNVRDYKIVTSVLRAYDAATGKHLWSSKTAPGISGEVCGTPLALRLTNGAEQLDVLITANGTVVRADDGQILRMYLGARENLGSPISNGLDQVFIAGGANKACYRLLMQDRDHVGAQTLWHVFSPHQGYDAGNYQLLQDGLLYSFGRRLDVHDAATGELLGVSSYLSWTRPGRCYPALAFVNGLLYIPDLGHYFGESMGVFHPGALSVVTPGRDFMVLARNKIGRLTGGPVFDGERIYLRGWDDLTCIGYTGQAGRVYEAETVAGEVLSQLFPGQPAAGAPVAVKLGAGLERRGARYGTALYAGRMPDNWLFAGPFPAQDAEKLRAEFSASDLSTIEETKVGTDTTLALALGQSKYPLRNLTHYSAAYWMKDKRLVWRKGDRMDVLAVNGGKLNSVNYFLTRLSNDFTRVLRLELDSPGVRVWLGGVELRHNQLVELPEGCIPLVVEVPVGDKGGPEPAPGPRLWPSHGALDQAEWLAGLKQRRPYLERALELAPQSETARRAGQLLQELGKR